jgi:hypothetical protein
MDFASPQRCEICTQPPIQWDTGALSLGIKWPGREAGQSPPSDAEFKEGVELCPHFPNTPSWRGAHLKRRDNFNLTLPFTLTCFCGFHIHSYTRVVDYLSLILYNITLFKVINSFPFLLLQPGA